MCGYYRTPVRDAIPGRAGSSPAPRSGLASGLPSLNRGSGSQWLKLTESKGEPPKESAEVGVGYASQVASLNESVSTGESEAEVRRHVQLKSGAWLRDENRGLIEISIELRIEGKVHDLSDSTSQNDPRSIVDEFGWRTDVFQEKSAVAELDLCGLSPKVCVGQRDQSPPGSADHELAIQDPSALTSGNDGGFPIH